MNIGSTLNICRSELVVSSRMARISTRSSSRNACYASRQCQALGCLFPFSARAALYLDCYLVARHMLLLLGVQWLEKLISSCSSSGIGLSGSKVAGLSCSGITFSVQYLLGNCFRSSIMVTGCYSDIANSPGMSYV